MIIETTMIALGRCLPSPTQPRKRFDEEKHNELTASMEQHGFTLSTLLVRPWPGRPGWFEIVAGERRWRAAGATKFHPVTVADGVAPRNEPGPIPEVPCIIRVLTDQEVLEMQLIENIQRQDLTAIEEAVHYQRLLAMVDADQRPLYTFERLAQRVGLTAKWVRDRVCLCDLGDEERREVEAGTLPPKTAYLIARIPDPKLRAAASKKILHPQHEAGPLSYKRAEEMIQHEFVRDLRGATFAQDDADLLAIAADESGKRVAGGMCKDCPMKLGNAMPDAVPQRHNTCLNPLCFEQKQQRVWARWQEEETDPEANRRAATELESHRLFPLGNQLAAACGLVELADRPDGNDLRPGLDAPATWLELTKGAKLAVTVARDRFGKTHELVDRAQAVEAARTLNKHDIFKAAVGQRDKPKDADTRKEEEKTKTAVAEEKKRVAIACLDEVKGRATLKNAGDLIRLVIEREIDASKGHENFFRRHGLPIGSPVTKQIAKRPFAELAAILVEFVVCDGGYIYEIHDAILPWLKIFGVDVKAVTKRIAGQIALEKATAERTENIEVSWTDGLRGGARKFEFNSNGVCEKPAVLVLPFPASTKIKVRLSVARAKKGWLAGYDLASGKNGSGASGLPALRSATAFPTVRAALLDTARFARKYLAGDGAPAGPALRD
jgi:ParB-like chromosome segregation protein Spo0J